MGLTPGVKVRPNGVEWGDTRGAGRGVPRSAAESGCAPQSSVTLGGLGSLGISLGMFVAKSFRSWDRGRGGRGVPQIAVIAVIARERRDRGGAKNCLSRGGGLGAIGGIAKSAGQVSGKVMR